MSSPYEGSFDDLFDFPEVPGLEEFGLVPPVREGVDLSEFEMAPGTLAPAKPAAADAPTSPETEDADDGDRSFIAEARPNPPVPEGVTDLDEDLFGFDELFSLENDPFYNGTLGADGMPANDLFVADAGEGAEPGTPANALPQDELPAEVGAPEAAPAPVDTAGAAEAPAVAEPAASAQAPAAAPAAPSAAAAQPAPAPAPAPAQAPPSHAPGSLMGQQAGPAGALDRGPRILLPEDVPYGAADNSKMIWALIACFLIVNTGIFWLAHMASTNVNNSLTEATGLIANALAQGQQRAPSAPATTDADVDAPTVASTPPDAGDDVSYEVETPAAETAPTGPAEANVPTEPEPLTTEPVFERPEPWVDPRDFSDPLTFAVNSAKAMLEEGRYEDARRLLNHVLANQSRMPLKVSLREEIDFLIGLTYYVQGTATAPEAGEEVPR